VLDGTGSSVGDTINYIWVALEGGDIVTGEENLLMPQVTGPGLYQIEVTNAVTQCSSTDTIRVEDDQELPEAIINAGAETVTLACDAALVLSAATSNNSPVVEYEWFDFENMSIQSTSSISVSELGTYYLQVFNPVTGCEASDTIQVVPNEDFPVITTIPAADTSLTCLVDTIQITASVDGVLPENFIFTWTSSGGGQIVPDTDTTLMPLVVSEGIYSLEVTDTTTNCTALAQIAVVLDTLSPMADAGPDLTLTCAIATDTLVGMNTSMGDNMAYSWTDANGNEVGTEAFLIVDGEGVYCLEVTNVDNGCTATDCAEVFFDNELPVVTINEPVQNINCANDTLTLQPDMITSPNGDYNVLWTPGPFVGTDTLDFVMVDVPGVYTIAVTDPVTGCVGTGEYVIGIDTIAPISDAGMDDNIDCVTDQVTLGGNSSSGTEFTYSWLNVVDGETPVPDNEATVTVMTPGTYELTVLNINNGCSDTDQVVVGEDFTEPVVTIGDPLQITCIDECIALAATVDGLTDFTVEWQGLDGGTVDPADALETTVCEPGNYVVIITDNANGCIGQDTVLVVADQTTPVIDFTTPALITCANITSQIDASATGMESEFNSIEWIGPGTISPASGSLVVDVDEPGVYELTVIFASNGCSASLPITVDSDTEAPVADAGEDFVLECGEVGAADGSGSSQGPEFVYLWTAISGTIVGDDTVISPMVEGAGTYSIQVTNNDNGCVSTDTVMISFEFPPDAMTMPDSLQCGDTITISASLPAGTSGVWTSLGGAVVDSPTAEVSDVAPLNPGNNLFVWTLSADGCPDYSADTLVIMSEVAPVANNDLIELTEEIRFGSTNILANDITSSSEVTITILSEPAFGQMDSLVNGVYHYSVGPGAEGEVEVTYQICSTNCPDKCDEATIIIIVPEDPNEPEIANTITPNEDGLNDMLIFDIIANNAPDEFPDNEIIIFNRWGDIVYTAAPYNNDWNGLNAEGNELPHGTYYYILRLNISKGEIIRGDVTIIR
jgi:gliding motility-associated-like protein